MSRTPVSPWAYLVPLVAACGGMSEETFLLEHRLLTCDKLQECDQPVVDEWGGCDALIDLAEARDPSCEYSLDFAKRCLEELETMNCVDWSIEKIDKSSSCRAAYQGATCPWYQDAPWYLGEGQTLYAPTTTPGE